MSKITSYISRIKDSKTLRNSFSMKTFGGCLQTNINCSTFYIRAFIFYSWIHYRIKDKVLNYKCMKELWTTFVKMLLLYLSLLQLFIPFSPLHANEKFFSENEQQHQRVDLVMSNVIRKLFVT